MNMETWLFFVATELALCASPGPAVLFIVSQSLNSGTRQSLWSNAGILSTNAVFFALSATGLGAILLASHGLFTAIKYVGATYLVYVGVTTFFGKGIGLDDGGTAGMGSSSLRSYWRGVAIQAANPKALIFFVALLPQFIDPSQGQIALQFAILGATSIVIEFLVLATYAGLAATATRHARKPGFVVGTNRVAGSLLVGAGAGIGLRPLRE